MSFNQNKIEPLRIQPLAVVNNIRSTNIQTTSRDRQCFFCLGKILKGEQYINHQFRHDKSILTISFHKDCF